MAFVTPAEAGVQGVWRRWIPAPYHVRGRLFAGMTETGAGCFHIIDGIRRAIVP